MAKSSSSKKSQAGQRGNLSSASGRKERSPTSAAHQGSRMDPSHTVKKARTTRAAATGKGKKK